MIKYFASNTFFFQKCFLSFLFLPWLSLSPTVEQMRDIKNKDAGTYTVTATNEHGSEQVPATLMVTDKMEEVADWKSQLKKT